MDSVFLIWFGVGGEQKFGLGSLLKFRKRWPSRSAHRSSISTEPASGLGRQVTVGPMVGQRLAPSARNFQHWQRFGRCVIGLGGRVGELVEDLVGERFKGQVVDP